MDKGTIRVKGESLQNKIQIWAIFDNKGKKGENAGVMARFSNEISDLMRKFFNAHQIEVTEYREHNPGEPYFYKGKLFTPKKKVKKEK